MESPAVSRAARGRPRGFDSDGSQNVIQSLDRAIDVLEVLAKGGAKTLTRVAGALDGSPATIYRILTTFQLRGIAELNPADQTWSVGASAFRIGATFLRRNSLSASALPAMRHLTDSTGETSNLGIERGDQVVFVSQVETHESIRAFFPPGTQTPIHASGIGKALLSTHSEARLNRLLSGGPLEAFTAQTIVTREGLQAEVHKIRARGYAFDNEEKASGMRCIAAAIFDYQGQAVAGISISGPAHRLPDADVARIGALVSAAAADVSRALGAQI